MTIIVTGSYGLIGGAIFDNLLGSTYTPIGIDKITGDSIESFTRRITCNEEKIDAIIHCAANCIIREVISNPELAKENIDSTFDILEYARTNDVKKFIYFSSSRVTHDETNPYIASKKFGEELTKAYCECYGIDYLIIRPETVWGLEDSHMRVITNWIDSAECGEDLLVYGSEDKELPPIHVKDFVKAFFDLFTSFMENDINNVTYTISGKIMTAKEITDIILDVTNSKSNVLYFEPEVTQPQTCKPADITHGAFRTRLEEELK